MLWNLDTFRLQVITIPRSYESTVSTVLPYLWQTEDLSAENVKIDTHKHTYIGYRKQKFFALFISWLKSRTQI